MGGSTVWPPVRGAQVPTPSQRPRGSTASSHRGRPEKTGYFLPPGPTWAQQPRSPGDWDCQEQSTAQRPDWEVKAAAPLLEDVNLSLTKK